MEKSNKVSREQAENEVDAWMSYKKIDSDGNSHKQEIDILVDAIVSGILTIETTDTKSPDFMFFIQTLKFPPEAENPVRSLRYRPRLSVNETQRACKGLKTDDLISFGIAYGQALTGQPRAVIGNLDSIDFKITQAITGFFS